MYIQIIFIIIGKDYDEKKRKLNQPDNICKPLSKKKKMKIYCYVETEDKTLIETDIDWVHKAGMDDNLVEKNKYEFIFRIDAKHKICLAICRWGINVLLNNESSYKWAAENVKFMMDLVDISILLKFKSLREACLDFVAKLLEQMSIDLIRQSFGFESSGFKDSTLKKLLNDNRWHHELKKRNTLNTPYPWTLPKNRRVIKVIFEELSERLSSKKLDSLRSLSKEWKEYFEGKVIQNAIYLKAMAKRGSKTLSKIPPYLLSAVKLNLRYIGVDNPIFIEIINKFENVEHIIYDGRYNEKRNKYFFFFF